MRFFWKKILADVATFSSAIGAIISLKTPNQPFTGWQVSLISIFGLLAVVALALDIVEYRENKPRVLRSTKKIRNYMYRWISTGGAVAVFSRDLTWVADDQMVEMLKSKATANELTLVLPRETELSRQLSDCGAETIYYSGIEYTIRSRFTVINLYRPDPSVAIGRRVGKLHVVDEYSVTQGPVTQLAIDLIEILRRYSAVQGSS